MAKFKLLETKVRMERKDIIKYQILTHCYLNRLALTDSEAECLTLIAILGEQDLSEFCQVASKNQIFKSTQSVRNCLVKLEKAGLLTKHGEGRKRLNLSSNLQLITEGNILVKYNFYHLES